MNFSKSHLYFSPNTPSGQRQELSNILGMGIVDVLDNYLGLLLIIGKNKTNVFGYLVHRFTN